MADIKLISDRISYREGEKEQTVVILPDRKTSRFTLLSIWLALFIACGIAVFVQLFMGYDSNVKFFLVAFLVFWFYFVLKAGRAWLYMKNGGEMLRLADGRLSLKLAIGKYGKAHDFFVDNMSFVNIRETEKKSFSTELENSFWVLGGHQLHFLYNGKDVRFGIRISEKEAKALKEVMNRWIKRMKYPDNN